MNEDEKSFLNISSTIPYNIFNTHFFNIKKPSYLCKFLATSKHIKLQHHK